MILEINTKKDTVVVTQFDVDEVFDINEIAHNLNNMAFKLSKITLEISEVAQEAIVNGGCESEG